MKASSHRIKNYDIFSEYSFFTPKPSDIFVLTLLFLVGALAGNVVGSIFLLFMQGAGTDYMMLISYPIMFIPPMMYAMYKSRGNALFETGYAIDSKHFGSSGALTMSIIVMLSTLALSFVMDIVNHIMPPMPEWLETVLKNMTQGKFWVNFICVSIFAPFFEEWLCRGMVLRGLLNYRHKSRPYADEAESDAGRGIKPVWAIVLSALFFALIHLNPWQAVPAFALGCLFGYIYYRTGSLWLTMLMHFTNNTFALIIGNIDSLKDVDNFIDIMPAWLYILIAAACVFFLYLSLKYISKIEVKSHQGNCDETSSAV